MGALVFLPSLALPTVSMCFALVSLSEEEHQDRRPPSRGKVELEDQEEEEEEKGMEKDTPLVALAPDAALPEEQPSAAIHVSTSPAFQCLDEVRLVNVVRHHISWGWQLGGSTARTNTIFCSGSGRIYSNNL